MVETCSTACIGSVPGFVSANSLNTFASDGICIFQYWHSTHRGDGLIQGVLHRFGERRRLRCAVPVPADPDGFIITVGQFGEAAVGHPAVIVELQQDRLGPQGLQRHGGGHLVKGHGLAQVIHAARQADQFTLFTRGWMGPNSCLSAYQITSIVYRQYFRKKNQAAIEYVSCL